MQCASCHAVYAADLTLCPRCQKPTAPATGENDQPAAKPKSKAVSAPDKNAAAPPTLIEFPGVARRQQPAWRKDLSERVRVVRERRAQEANHPKERPTAEQAAAVKTAEAIAPRLVPHVDPPPVNPIVAAALRRIERARESAATSVATGAVRSNGGGAATAVARVVDVAEEAAPGVAQAAPAAPEIVDAPPPETKKQSEPKKQSAATDATKTHKLIAIPPPPSPKNETVVATAPIETKPEEKSEEKIEAQPKPRRVITEVVDDALLAKREAEREAARGATTATEILDDQAPLSARAVGAGIDLLVVAFVASPFAAIIELTSGNWGDWRVVASMLGVVALVLFLYSAAAVALAGRTWGMSLVSLFVVDAATGLPPTLGQAARRAFFFLLSLVTLGLGILYSLFDAEHRALHDQLSNTIVVRD